MAPAPDSQLLKFDEATVLAKNLRSGLDSHPHSRVIEKEITNLLYRELDLFQLHVDDSSGHKFSVLTIQRALKEGETALVARTRRVAYRSRKLFGSLVARAATLTLRCALAAHMACRLCLMYCQAHRCLRAMLNELQRPPLSSIIA